MNSFSSELGVPFSTSLEAPHVIDTESQLWAAIISRGPRSYPLNASYKTADSYAFQDSLGTSIEEICKTVPGGCLIFFPSYKLMEKLSCRWQETGQWARLNARKPLFVGKICPSSSFSHQCFIYLHMKDLVDNNNPSKIPQWGLGRVGLRRT
ncbi:unnamed protein product [Cuscuta campestris]|uniref:ATP-dependent helicase C-terminal domain-containing protein n=1 Tax=Cuscuta campestris TaxID=132261 RepID=A0A484KTK7_9ASTE|nr:unnamed protein product [Cuscuta campestris]